MKRFILCITVIACVIMAGCGRGGTNVDNTSSGAASNDKKTVEIDGIAFRLPEEWEMVKTSETLTHYFPSDAHSFYTTYGEDIYQGIDEMLEDTVDAMLSVMQDAVEMKREAIDISGRASYLVDLNGYVENIDEKCNVYLFVIKGDSGYVGLGLVCSENADAKQIMLDIIDTIEV